MTSTGRYRFAVAGLTGLLYILATIVMDLLAVQRTLVTDGLFGGAAALAAQVTLGRFRP